MPPTEPHISELACRSLAKQNAELKYRLAVAEENYRFLFNHPLLRAYRGLRQLFNNRRTAVSDLKAARRDLFRKRRKKKIEESSFYSNPSTDLHWHKNLRPEVFLGKFNNDEFDFVIGSATGLLPSPIELLPTNAHLFAVTNSHRHILVRSDPYLSGTAWSDAITLRSLRLNRSLATFLQLAYDNHNHVYFEKGTNTLASLYDCDKKKEK